MNVTEQKLQWGVNVAPGYVGLLSRRNDFVSAGIDWFERWDALPGDPPVSHAFIIQSWPEEGGSFSTIEAFSNGVRQGYLSAYLADPECAVLVRKPVNYTDELGKKIVLAASAHIGESYDYAEIVAVAGANSLLGHAIDRITHGWWSQHLEKLAANDHSEICSELVAKALRAAGAITGQEPAYAITPQMLMADPLDFEAGAIELAP